MELLTSEVSADVKVKRRRLALDYLRQIPDAKVRLDHYVDGRGSSTAEQRHFQSEGLDALQCGTMACLAGWLWTMPEYRDWCRARRIQITNSFNTSQFLGCREVAGIFSRRCNVVDGPAAMCPGVTDKTLAIRRLEQLLAESEREIGVEPRVQALGIMMNYVIWIIEDAEARIVDIKTQLPSTPLIGQSHNYVHSYGQFEELMGKKKAEAALKRYYR